VTDSRRVTAAATPEPSSPRHRLEWRTATLAGARQETATARTLAFDVPGWPGHLPGQHVIVRLRAEDGYTAQRSYSIASPPGVAGGADGDRIELTVQRLSDGEVSPYLTDVIEPGDQVEVRGPIGSWFVLPPGTTAPVQLIAGGSGIVPLMSMIRAVSEAVPVRLLYSARTPADVIYGEELERRAGRSRLAITYLFTRVQRLPGTPRLVPALPGSGNSAVMPVTDAPALSASLSGRISAAVVAEATWGPGLAPEVFVCGPSGFVEAASSLLVAAGHAPASVKTERFGPTS
jgi:ferredoxin-NADP reductase